MANKLNSMRFLESQNVDYEAVTYDETIHDAVEVAARARCHAINLYKTLVVERAAGSKPVLIMIAANRQLDLKRFAAAIGEKKGEHGSARRCRKANRTESRRNWGWHGA